MSQLIAERSAHWYRFNGERFEPFYEVMKADKTGMRATTLADARKTGAVPSVTTVLSVLNKPQLNDWRVEQGIVAALSLPRLPDEPLDVFARRVVKDSEMQSETARNFGTELHAAIEAELTLPSYAPSPAIEPFMGPVRQWLAANVEEIHASEIIVGDRGLGIAGKLDLDCTLRNVGRCILDFKSQGISNGKPTFYPEFPLQLSAYTMCRYLSVMDSDVLAAFKMASVVIDSRTPGGIHVKVYEDVERHWRLFQYCFELWKFQKNYEPSNLLS